MLLLANTRCGFHLYVLRIIINSEALGVVGENVRILLRLQSDAIY